MALDATELLIIGVMAVVIFLRGPQKIPELARAPRRAKREFDTASKEVSSAMTAAPSATAPRSGDELPIETARKLGIATEGKTREKTSREIVNKKSQ